MMLLPLSESSQVGAARRRAVDLGRARGLEPDSCDRLALIVTEIGTNLMRHAVEGELLLGPTEPHEPPGCHVIGIDAGPGVASLDRALEDGFTTAVEEDRGIGGGLGAIRRLSDAFDIHTDRNGTTVVASVAPGLRPGGPLDAAGVIVPKPGTEAGGDGWAFRPGRTRSLVLLLDVLGHGAKAARVAEGAVAAFRGTTGETLEETEPAVSEALAGERGAAMVIAEIPHGPGELRALGIGNIRGEVIRGNERSGILSAAGIAGQKSRGKAVLNYQWRPGALLVLTTDGLRERRRDDDPAGLMSRAPTTIAATLYRRRRRGSDDSGVVVVRSV